MIDVVCRLIIEWGYREFPDQMLVIASVRTRMFSVVGFLILRHRIQSDGLLTEAEHQIEHRHDQSVQRIIPNEPAIMFTGEWSKEDRLEPDQQIGDHRQKGVRTRAWLIHVWINTDEPFQWLQDFHDEVEEDES